MEPPIIKDPKNTNLDFSLSSTKSHISPTFLLQNGFINNKDDKNNHIDDPCTSSSDIEMIALQTVTYTSLKDLLPASPPSIMSPTHNSSWNEIPIKNPLVKQAALAYLQPMSTPPEVGDKGLFGRLRGWCFSECGCIGWLNDVVLRVVKDFFWERREDIDDDYDDEEDDYEKVD